MPAGTPLHKALQHISDAATTVSLYPLAVMLAAVAVLIIRTKVTPGWLGLAAGAAAVALAVNGSLIDVNAGPGIVLFLLWALAASIVLLRKTRHQPAQAARTHAATAA